ncbi:ABC transporter permease [Mucilaginibacter phyllosphaerae]|uniref:ABC transport system permease protein n=1 Tax=Mucilaginibacter phyllosphaerae TaxID=1812349 RepID=A0A4Y8A8T8_9SPHI|nr:FtsX-like permease family protein [Mucilaginibacter phyllosphaerae]MBB3970796.1 putative ABC transport system permease protein [Mucilaginibacter phyllosphaerae]TEW64264.1 FtsX-like permease family protein [Mucilaginibacter phyllosphaerae]GGH04655.1 ABC transporter permease [Mucilaginibacter phyllosphaerae]
MLKTNLKIAWRSLLKHKAYSLINIIGLSVGLTACLIVATVVIDELSYDKQWAKADNIYRILSAYKEVKGEELMPAAFSGLGPSLKKDLPEVQNYCRMDVVKNRLRFDESKDAVSFNMLRAEATVWNILDFKIVQGNPRRFVKGYTNLIITKKTQQQYFKGKDVIGTIVTTLPDFGEPQKYLITGVVDNLPQNTHLRADVMALSEYRAIDNKVPITGESYTFQSQYVLLKPGTDVKAFTQKVNNWYKQQLNGRKVDYLFTFQPIKDVYLKSDFAAVQDVHGSMRNVYIFAGVAALLLLIACINFINLTISRIFNRAKETGVRKVLGAGNSQLIIRFLSESVLFFAISFSLAIILYPFLLKPVETYLDHKLVVNLYSSVFLLVTIIGVLLISIATGLYPAWYLSRPKPAVILRDKIASDVGLNFLKKALVVGQFAISVTIIIITLVVHNQLNFMSHKDLGFDKNNLVNIDFSDWGKSGQSFKTELMRMPGVAGASITNWYPSSGSGNMSRTVKVGNEKLTLHFIQADADLPGVLKLKVNSGRIFNPNVSTDAIDQDTLMGGGATAKTKALIQNQPMLVTAYTAKLLNLKVNQSNVKFEGTTVGIVKDFYSESLHNKIKPTVLQALSNPRYGAMLIRVIPGTERAVLTGLNRLYKQYYPDNKPFEYNWVNELVDKQYKAEAKLQQLFTCFSLLIVFLACLGLFGLVSFTAEQRVKEIGIRKVLGANVSDIVALISKDYLWLVMIAFIIATPVAWYFMDKWLQNYAYRTHIQWWLFGIAGAAAVLISFFTISLQSVKAALANPVKSLRSE